MRAWVTEAPLQRLRGRELLQAQAAEKQVQRVRGLGDLRARKREVEVQRMQNASQKHKCAHGNCGGAHYCVAWVDR